MTACMCKCCIGEKCNPVALPEFVLPTNERCTNQMCRKYYPTQCDKPNENYKGPIKVDAKGEGEEVKRKPSTGLSTGGIVFLVILGVIILAALSFFYMSLRTGGQAWIFWHRPFLYRGGRWRRPFAGSPFHRRGRGPGRDRRRFIIR